MENKCFSVKSIPGESRGEVECVIATLNVIDHDGDLTEPGAFGEQEAPIVGAHNWRSAPLGKATISESGRDVIARLRFNLAAEGGREWFEALKFDFQDGRPLQQYSYGYDVLKSKPDSVGGRRIRRLQKVRVIEVSPVLVGAGINTRTLAVKAGVAVETQFEQLEQVLSDAEAFFGRLKEIERIRKGQGRSPFSKANQDRLAVLASRLEKILTEIKSASRAPHETVDRAARAFARFQALKEAR